MWHNVNDIPAVIGYAQQLHKNAHCLSKQHFPCMSAIHFSVLIQLKVGLLHELTEAATCNVHVNYVHTRTCTCNVHVHERHNVQGSQYRMYAYVGIPWYCFHTLCNRPAATFMVDSMTQLLLGMYCTHISGKVLHTITLP